MIPSGKIGMGFFATAIEGIAVAFDSLRSNKVRSGLTILGVTIGVLVVMVMAAVITGVNESFSELISGRGYSTFYVAHYDFSTVQAGTGLDEEEPDFFRNDPLDPIWVRDLSRLPGIQSASAYSDLQQQGGYEATWGSTDVEISLYGVSSQSSTRRPPSTCSGTSTRWGAGSGSAPTGATGRSSR